MAGKTLAVVLAVAIALGLAGCNREPRVRVGSKNFSEQLVLGEIVAQHLENRLHGHVSRKFNLGGTLLAQQAMVAGQLDVYPEYTGTALTAVLKRKPVKDPARVLAAVREGYKQWRLEWLDPLGFENTFAMAVRNEDGAALTLSAAAKQRSWIPCARSPPSRGRAIRCASKMVAHNSVKAGTSSPRAWGKMAGA